MRGAFVRTHHSPDRSLPRVRTRCHDNATGLPHTSARIRLVRVSVEQSEIQHWLEQLRVEHRDLDEVIHHLIDTRHHDTMRIQRLKKRKLALKDMIARLESELIPDLDA